MSIEKSPEQIPANGSALQQEKSVLEKIHEEALSGESYEDAVEALSDVEALKEFRGKLRGMPFSSFHEVVEEMTNINRAQASKERKTELMGSLINSMEEKVVRFSPRVADLYTGIMFEMEGKRYEPKYEMTVKKMAELKKEGEIKVLFSPKVSWEMKFNRIETRLTDYLLGARDLDKREGREMDDDIRKWREEKLKEAPTKPPEKRKESKPGVDPMERLKEGEKVPAIWSIDPAYGGYYKEQSFSKWDSSRNVWTEGEYVYSDVEAVLLREEEDPKKGLVNLKMSARVPAGQWVTLPVPYSHGLNSLKAGGRKCFAQKDQNGDLVIFAEGKGEDVQIDVILAPDPGKKFTSVLEGIKVPEMPSEFSKETNEELEKIRSRKRGNIAKAQAIASYVRSRIKYLAPKDRAEGDYYNDFYNSHPKGFASAVDEIKQADCDVANTYFAALCAKLDIPVRHCVGHSVKGKDKQGASNINSGTGHGWSEVWNEIKKEWVRIDATPPGDSQLEDEEEQQGSEFVPGDYGSQEAIIPSNEELEKLRQKLLKRKEELSYTKEERHLAEKAGVELKEARQIVKEINEAEQTRLPNGERVADALSRLFNAIVESRRSMELGYTGPVRASEGGEEIEDIVSHYIQSRSGDIDPRSRSLPTEEVKKRQNIGGFDLYIVGDKSGSMSNTAEGEALWEIQRRAEYLIFSSLHRFERNLERAGLQEENALSVRTQGISFRGSEEGEIDLDKSLSPSFSAQDKVKLWHSLTEQGMGNGDPEALGYIYEQISKEVGEIKKRGGKDDRLRLVIACSDGGYVGNDAQRMQILAEKLYKEFKAVVVGMGLTETAAEVPVVMDRLPYSHGDIVRDVNDLPALVAKYLVLEAIKLFPEKAKEDARQIIESSLNKFKNV